MSHSSESSGGVWPKPKNGQGATLTPKKLLKIHKLPLAAHLHSPSVPPELDLTRPLLLYNSYTSTKVRGVSLRPGKTDDLTPLGPGIVIPDSYTGWFCLVTSEGQTAPYYNTIQHVAQSQVAFFLTRYDVTALTKKQDESGRNSYQKTVVQSGHVLKLLGVYEDVNAKKSTNGTKIQGINADKYAQCLNYHNEVVFLPFSASGRFYATAQKNSTSGKNVYLMSQLLQNHKLPLTVRLVCGYIPRIPSNFTGVLRLEKAEKEHVILACTMTEEIQATLFEIEVSSNFGLTPVTDNLFSKSPIYLKTLSYCEEEVEGWRRQIKITHHITEKARMSCIANKRLIDQPIPVSRALVEEHGPMRTFRGMEKPRNHFGELILVSRGRKNSRERFGDIVSRGRKTSRERFGDIMLVSRGRMRSRDRSMDLLVSRGRENSRNRFGDFLVGDKGKPRELKDLPRDTKKERQRNSSKHREKIKQTVDRNTDKILERKVGEEKIPRTQKLEKEHNRLTKQNTYIFHKGKEEKSPQNTSENPEKDKESKRLTKQNTYIFQKQGERGRNPQKIKLDTGQGYRKITKQNTYIFQKDNGIIRTPKFSEEMLASQKKSANEKLDSKGINYRQNTYVFQNVRSARVERGGMRREKSEVRDMKQEMNAVERLSMSIENLDYSRVVDDISSEIQEGEEEEEERYAEICESIETERLSERKSRNMNREEDIYEDLCLNNIDVTNEKTVKDGKTSENSGKVKISKKKVGHQKNYRTTVGDENSTRKRTCDEEREHVTKKNSCEEEKSSRKRREENHNENKRENKEDNTRTEKNLSFTLLKKDIDGYYMKLPGFESLKTDSETNGYNDHNDSYDSLC